MPTSPVYATKKPVTEPPTKNLALVFQPLDESVQGLMPRHRLVQVSGVTCLIQNEDLGIRKTLCKRHCKGRVKKLISLAPHHKSWHRTPGELGAIFSHRHRCNGDKPRASIRMVDEEWKGKTTNVSLAFSQI